MAHNMISYLKEKSKLAKEIINDTISNIKLRAKLKKEQDILTSKKEKISDFLFCKILPKERKGKKLRGKLKRKYDNAIERSKDIDIKLNQNLIETVITEHAITHPIESHSEDFNPKNINEGIIITDDAVKQYYADLNEINNTTEETDNSIASTNNENEL